MANTSLIKAQRHAWLIRILTALAKDKEKFERDPHFQFKVHKIFTYVWLVNIVAASIVFFAFPGLWASASVFYLVLISLYSNFATDYGAVSASLAAQGMTKE